MVGLIITAIVLIVVLVAMFYSIEDGMMGRGVFVLALMFYTITMLVIDVEVMRKHEVKHKVTPTIKVECLGNKCDTTYVYKF